MPKMTPVPTRVHQGACQRPASSSGDIHRLYRHPHTHHPRQTVPRRRTAGVVLHHHSGGDLGADWSKHAVRCLQLSGASLQTSRGTNTGWLWLWLANWAWSM